MWINKLEKFSEVERERERERKREGGFTIGLLTGKTLPQAQLRGNRKMIPATKCPQVCVCVCVCVSRCVTNPRNHRSYNGAPPSQQNNVGPFPLCSAIGPPPASRESRKDMNRCMHKNTNMHSGGVQKWKRKDHVTVCSS